MSMWGQSVIEKKLDSYTNARLLNKRINKNIMHSYMRRQNLISLTFLVHNIF